MARKSKSEEFIEFIEEEAEETQTSLPTVEAEYIEETEAQDWYDYLRINLSELEDGDEYWGRPFLTEPETIQFDEEEAPKHRCRLLIIDDEEQEYLQININLKTSETIQNNVHNASGLYALIASLQNLQDPTWSKRDNRIRKVNLEDWIKYVNDLENMEVKVVAKTGSSFNYNSFRILSTK